MQHEVPRCNINLRRHAPARLNRGDSRLDRPERVQREMSAVYARCKAGKMA